MTVHELTPTEAIDAFDAACQRDLGISGEEFLAAYASGTYRDEWSYHALCRLEMLLPLVERR